MPQAATGTDVGRGAATRASLTAPVNQAKSPTRLPEEPEYEMFAPSVRPTP